MARNERGQHCRTLNLQSSSRIIKTYHSIKNWGYEPHIETETAPNACLLDKGGNQVRDLKIVPLYQVQTNPGPYLWGTASSRSWDWFKTGGHVFCYYWWFWVSAIQLFLVRHGNNIGRETGRGTGNSWRRIEKVIRSDSFWVCAATADAQTASNSLYLWFVVSASLSTDFQWQDASESSRYRHTSSSVNIGGGWENYTRTWKHLEARIQIDFRWVLGGVAVA